MYTYHLGTPNRCQLIRIPFEIQMNRYMVHHFPQVKYSLKNMLPITWKIRGLSIDNAIAQMEFDTRKGAKILKELLEEAQNIAVKEHNIEFRSNLWVAECFVTKGDYVKSFRKHARGRMGIVEFRFVSIKIFMYTI